MKKLPKEILVYQVKDSDVEYMSVARCVEEIPEDAHGELVGNYVLNNTYTFKIKRELK